VSTDPEGAGGLRERNKAKRRDAVLEAALDLFDRDDPAPVTTERIAHVAELSVATVYNLVGTREQLLMALIDRLIADLVATSRAVDPPADPIRGLRLFIELSVDVLVTRPTAYRRIVLQLTAVASADLHTQLSPGTLAATAFRHAQQSGAVRTDLDADALATQLYLSFNGALLRWAAGALTNDDFKTAALHGLATVLAAAATSKARSRALADLRELGGALGPWPTTEPG
jgi:AcrR family transcriptional regulator